jgi:secreted trypsin-like serine protease
LITAFPFISQQQPTGPQTRIIGGSDAQQGRFPYVVSFMTATNQHVCGGTLVAPDMVLTAAHCQGVIQYAWVGPYDRNDPKEQIEEFFVLSPEYVHPLYDEDVLPYDFMLLKLSRSSSKPYILLNDNPNLPKGNIDNELAVLGFGYTDVSNSNSESFVLQVADLNYIPNDICERSKDPFISETYRGLVTDDMLCAQDEGQDSCQGDSGGPLIIQGSSISRDVLVGVVSWGFGCAVPAFPGVYGRVSDQLDWIKANICEHSDNPPQELKCANHEYTPDPTPADSAPVTIIITLDDYPNETGWSITNKLTRQVLVEIVDDTYQRVRSTVQETVFLLKGETFTFEIKDTHGDGLGSASSGNYIVSLGRNPGGVVLVAGGGDFGATRTHDFVIPLDYDDPEDPDVPIIQDGQIPLTIQIQLDAYPQQIGWRLDRLGLEVQEIIRVTPGIYSMPKTLVTRTLILEEGELYNFGISDVFKDGIEDGFVKLFLGTTNTDDDTMLILDEDGAFGEGIDFSFMASLTGGNNNEPTSTPIPSDYYLTLEIRMDLYPDEIGVQLRMTDPVTATERRVTDTVIFFRPPRYYSGSSETVVVEQIPIPRATVGTENEYTFIITDSFGDGLCCGISGQLESGYSLYEGDPSDGIEIISSRMEATSREVTTIVLDAPETLPTPAKPTVDVVVTIMFDEYPEETGFYIQDMSGTKMVDFPPGTYADLKNTLMEEVVRLEIGVYTFAIVDKHGDGLEGDNKYYNVRLKDGGNRPALLTGSDFKYEESHIFIVEGVRATYPLSIVFTTDSQPQEFGLAVKRLGLVGADALTASVPQGTYTTSTQSQTVSVMLVEGGLYRILFEDQGGNGIDSKITIVIGSTNDPNSKTYTVAGNELGERFQVKLFAGALPPTPSNAKTLELRVLMDQYPHEVEWILLSSTSEAGVDIKAMSEAEVIAYGPRQLYSQNLASKQLVETIPLPGWSGERTLTMIVTDSEGDGGMYTNMSSWALD